MEAGGVFGHGGVPFGGGVSVGIGTIPDFSVSSELTFFTTGNGNGSAGTLDLRLHSPRRAVGLGIGVGSIGNTASTTIVYNALVAESIASHLALEARVYMGPLRPSSLFTGLRFSF